MRLSLHWGEVAFRFVAFSMLIGTYLISATLMQLLEIKVALDTTGASPRTIRDIISFCEKFPGGATVLLCLVMFVGPLVIQIFRRSMKKVGVNVWLLLSVIFGLFVCCSIASAHAVLGWPYVLAYSTDPIAPEWGALWAAVLWIALEIKMTTHKSDNP